MKKPKILYLMCGIPGSGKTTYIKNEMSKMTPDLEVVHISRDNVRFSMLSNEDEYFSKEKEVFNKFIELINKALKDSDIIYVDATHLNEKSRNKTLDRLNLTEEVKIIPIYFDVPLQICLERNELRSGRAYVPPDVIKNMNNSYFKPSFNEKYTYTDIIIVD